MFYSRLTGLKMSTALASILIASAGGVMAGPTGGQVVGGDASISTPDSNTTVIDQKSNRGIIEWNTFNLGSGEQLRFNQPDANAITLNRVTGGQGPSSIDGRIDANGRIIISNRDGIVFGDGAVIDVGALIATTADIENDAFMKGSLEFDRSGNPDGSVINRGSISAKDGGLIALVAPHAENSGILSARVGRVAVAGGDRFTIDFSGSEFLRLAIDPDSPAAKYLAKNSGRIEAEGGHVLLTTQTASDALSGVVNNSGIVEATAVDTSGGRIRLVAGGGAKVRNSGTVRSRGTTGGTIEITAEQVELTKTSVIDASGDTGGGTVLVGGDYLGSNAGLAALNPLAPHFEDYPVYSASALVAETGSQVHADALSYGDGGKVIFWSNDHTVTGATITARGGLSFGDGGLVETSGGFLDVRTAADTSAANGDGGTWLLDPRNITIVDGVTNVADVILSDGVIIPADDADTQLSAILIEARLNFGERVVVATEGTTGSEDGDIIVEADIIKSSGPDAELWLLAEDDIIVRSGVSIESNSNALGIVLNTYDQIRAGNMDELDTNGGFLILRSGDDIEIGTNSRVPSIGIQSIPAEAASRVDVELDFQDDHIELTYTDDEIDVPTGGFELLEVSGGGIFINLEGSPRNLVLNDRSFLLNDGRGEDVNFSNISAYGTSDGDALNDVPEVINFEDVVGISNLGIDPPGGITPVIEVSTDEGQGVDVLVPTSPAGQDIIAALDEAEEPIQPVPVQPDGEPDPTPPVGGTIGEGDDGDPGMRDGSEEDLVDNTIDSGYEPPIVVAEQELPPPLFDTQTTTSPVGNLNSELVEQSRLTAFDTVIELVERYRNAKRNFRTGIATAALRDLRDTLFLVFGAERAFAPDIDGEDGDFADLVTEELSSSLFWEAQYPEYFERFAIDRYGYDPRSDAARAGVAIFVVGQIFSGRPSPNTVSRIGDEFVAFSGTEARRALRERLVSAGEMSANQKAHHIIEFSSNNSSSVSLRRQMEQYNLNLNSVGAGVGLTHHSGRHADRYSELLEARLNTTSTREEFIAELSAVKSELKQIDNLISAGSIPRRANASGDLSYDTVLEWIYREQGI